jgi:hypothetical protein
MGLKCGGTNIYFQRHLDVWQEWCQISHLLYFSLSHCYLQARWQSRNWRSIGIMKQDSVHILCKILISFERHPSLCSGVYLILLMCLVLYGISLCYSGWPQTLGLRTGIAGVYRRDQFIWTFSFRKIKQHSNCGLFTWFWFEFVSCHISRRLKVVESLF